MRNKVMAGMCVLVVLMLLVAVPAAVMAQEGEGDMADGEMMMTAVACQQDYTVQADDWLSKIADKFYGDVLAYPAIAEATNLHYDAAMMSSDDAMMAEGDDAMMAEGDDAMMAEGDDAMMAEGDDATMAEGDDAMMAEGDDAMMAEGDDAMMAGSYAHIENPDIIEPGWVLCIPSPEDASNLLAEKAAMAQ